MEECKIVKCKEEGVKEGCCPKHYADLLMTAQIDKELSKSMFGKKEKLIAEDKWTGRMSQKLGRSFGKVIEGYEKVLKIKVEDEQEMTLQRAEILFNKEAYQEALGFYMEIKDHYHRDPQIQLNMARSAIEVERWEVAIEALKSVVQYHPTYQAAYFYLAVSYEGQKDYELALATLRELVELNPHHVGACFRLGRILEKWNRIDESIAYYNKALQLLPLTPIYQAIGQCYDQKEDYVQAISFYKKAISVKTSPVGRTVL